MTIHLDHPVLDTGADALDARARCLAERRTSIGRDVEGLLGTWRGASADRFAEHWAQWAENADVLIVGLTARTDALRVAHALAAASDAEAGMSSAQLRERLG